MKLRHEYVYFYIGSKILYTFTSTSEIITCSIVLKLFWSLKYNFEAVLYSLINLIKIAKFKCSNHV